MHGLKGARNVKKSTILRASTSLISLALFLSWGCGGNQVNTAIPPGPSNPLPGSDTTNSTDLNNPTDLSNVIDINDPGLPDLGPPKDPNAQLPSQSGVVYTGHFLDKTLRMTRIDGAFPETGPKIEMADYTHDMALDPVSDTLYVAHDLIRQVTVYGLTRPNNPSDPLTTPFVLTSMAFTDTPRFVTVDPFNRRLYVSAAPDTGENLLTQMHIYVYDITDPSLPLLLTLEPFVVPVHVTLSFDSARNLLFLADIKTNDLLIYDTAYGALNPLPGATINLRTLYPQENNTGFQARSLLAVSSQNQLFAARSQGANSELMAFTYNPGIPSGITTYSMMANTADFIPLADEFDIDVPVEQRTNLLDAFIVMHDPNIDSLFMVANAWNGSASSAFVYPMRKDLSIAPGCGQFEGFGCFFNNGFSATQTDGAACIDTTHRRVVGTSVPQNSDGEPGTLHIFSYDQNLGMAPQKEQDGSNPLSGLLPVAAVCH